MTEENAKQNKKDRTVRAAKFVLSMTARILLELIESYEDYAFLYSHRFNDNRSIREARYDYEAYVQFENERMRKQAIKRLRENKYIKMRKEGDRVVMALTKNGKIKALQALIRISNDYYFDDRVCLVSFDFPEAARVARNNFRLFLKEAGFGYVQGSVWSIKKNVSGAVNELVKLLKIGRWVKIFIVVK
jgi:hypothetical protein